MLTVYYLWLADGTKYGVHEVASGRSRIYKGSFTYKGITEADAENVSFSGGEFLATASGFTPNYVISDRLGSPRVVMDSNGSTLVRNSYYPFGLTHYDYLYTEQLLKTNRYHFNGKEKQTFSTLIDYHLLDYGSRMYDPYLCRWMNIAPLAESNPMFTGYAYTRNNPVNRIDLMGLADMAVNAGSTDWVYSEGGGYEWMDNVTSVETTPEGFRYVGPKDADIVKDMGYQNLYGPLKQSRMGSWLDGDTGGWGVQRVKVDVDALFEVNPIVSYKKENRTDNNKTGRTFEGLEFSADFSYESHSPANPSVELPLSLIAKYQNGLVRQTKEISQKMKSIDGYTKYKIRITANKDFIRNNHLMEMKLTGKPILNQGIGSFIPYNAITPMVPISMRPFNITQPLNIRP